uniref:hypothetical protein n=1 Tax=Bacillus licheniformis TaxID=1402 RepID=UPI001E4FECE7|nr:hypothetical protein [Bacillus licheniformis]
MPTGDAYIVFCHEVESLLSKGFKFGCFVDAGVAGTKAVEGFGPLIEAEKGRKYGI